MLYPDTQSPQSGQFAGETNPKQWPALHEGKTVTMGRGQTRGKVIRNTDKKEIRRVTRLFIGIGDRQGWVDVSGCAITNYRHTVGLQLWVGNRV